MLLKPLWHSFDTISTRLAIIILALPPFFLFSIFSLFVFVWLWILGFYFCGDHFEVILGNFLSQLRAMITVVCFCVLDE